LIYETDQIQAFVAEVIALSEAFETQVSLSGGDLRVTRLADNIIQMNRAERWLEVDLQVAWGSRDRWRVGGATTNRLATGDIAALLERATEAALSGDHRPDYAQLPHPWDFESPPTEGGTHYDTGTARSGTARRADEVAKLALPCRRLGYRAWGHVSVGEGGMGLDGGPGLIAVANSNELFQLHLPTTVSFAGEVHTPAGGVGRGSAVGRRYSDLGIDALAEQIIGDAEVPPETALAAGRYDAVLDAPAVSQLLSGLVSQFEGAVAERGESALGRRVGNQVLGDNISIAADPRHRLLVERPFDAEGWPNRRVQLMTNGVVDGFVHERTLAERYGGSAVGHYRGLGGGAAPEHLVLEGDTGTTEELVSTLQNGLLVRRFEGGIRFLPGLFARAFAPTGAFRIAGGRAVGAPRDVSFEIDVLSLLNDVRQLGAAVRAGRHVAPPILVSGIGVVE